MERKICIYFSYNFSFIGCYQTTLRSNGEHNYHISLYLLGKTISPVSFAKNLGIYITQYLTNGVHITKTAFSCMNS